jgi:competence protein ComEC
MVKGNIIDKEPKGSLKEIAQANKRFISSVVLLVLLASFIWGLALNSQWRQVLYTYLKQPDTYVPQPAPPAPERISASPKKIPLFVPVEPEKEKVYEAPEELTVTYFDVGQGLAHLIQIPSGKVIMYDAGERNKPAKPSILRFLRGAHIKRIDVLVASHPHSDHIGGFIPILSSDEFDIGEVVDPGLIYYSPKYTAFLNLVTRKRISYRYLREGDILDWGPDVFVQVLSPPRDYLWEGANDNSVVLKLIYGKTSFLFTGDIGQPAIDKLISDYGRGIEVDVVQVPHHGSNTSNDRDFIRLVGAAYAITSGSGGPPFGHPTPEIIKRWKEAGAQMYHTHLNGNITVFSDGEKIRVETLR